MDSFNFLFILFFSLIKCSHTSHPYPEPITEPEPEPEIAPPPFPSQPPLSFQTLFVKKNNSVILEKLSHIFTLEETFPACQGIVDLEIDNKGNYYFACKNSECVYMEKNGYPICTRDRSYYHYNAHVSGISVYKDILVTCQDSFNDYAGTKTPNMFMGLTLYNLSTELIRTDGSQFKNLVGQVPFLVHSDMLHEAPNCSSVVSINNETSDNRFENRYIQIDNYNQQVVITNFLTIHGPGSMDHSTAFVERIYGIPLSNETKSLTVDTNEKVAYFVDKKNGRVFEVHYDTGVLTRDASHDYVIRSSTENSFNYKIKENVLWRVVVSIENLEYVSIYDNDLYIINKYGKVYVMNRYDRNIYYSFETGKTPTSMKVLNNSLYIVSNDTVYRYDSDPNTYTESSLLSSTRRIGESCTEDAQCEHTICSSSNVCELYSTQYSPFNNLHNYLNSPVYLNSFVNQHILLNRSYAGYFNPYPIMEPYFCDTVGRNTTTEPVDCNLIDFDSLLLGNCWGHPCLPNDAHCLNGGTVNYKSSSGYTCECLSAFYGDMCQLSTMSVEPPSPPPPSPQSPVCSEISSDVCAGPGENCYFDALCNDIGNDPYSGRGCNAGGTGQTCRFCGFGLFTDIPCPPKNFYVSHVGLENASGSLEDPFNSVQTCVSASSLGGTCIIREGIYHEIVDVTQHSNITIRSYKNELVLLDGSVSINTPWTIHNNHIWKTTFSKDVWQLWVDYTSEMIMSRWPNIGDNSVWDREETWGHGLMEPSNSNVYQNGELIDKPHNNVDLSKNVTNATNSIAILNVGSFRTWSRRVLTHVGSNITYDTVSSWKEKHHYYFLEGKLDFLDEPGEWFYDTSTKTIYFWPPNNRDPNTLNVRGKVQSYFFKVSNVDNIVIKDLRFFGTTFEINKCTGCIIENCHFTYPSYSKRMLGVVDQEPEISLFKNSEYGQVRDSSFRFTDGMALKMSSGNMVVTNTYFYHIDTSASDNPSLQTTIQLDGSNNIISRCTMHKLGASATINPGNRAIVEYNDIYDTGLVQSDGAISQMMVAQQTDAVVRYNWFHDTVKYGARFDGNGDGMNGTMHHNVIWNCGKGIMIKGNNHRVFSNTVFDNTNSVNGNDILIINENGMNSETLTINNAINRLSGHRTIYNTASSFVPGIKSNNWERYITHGENVADQLVDPYGLNGFRDFRPKSNSSLVDTGIPIQGITDVYNGTAPDIGAYEYGVEPWIPGITWNRSFLYDLNTLLPTCCHRLFVNSTSFNSINGIYEYHEIGGFGKASRYVYKSKNGNYIYYSEYQGYKWWSIGNNMSINSYHSNIDTSYCVENVNMSLWTTYHDFAPHFTYDHHILSITCLENPPFTDMDPSPSIPPFQNITYCSSSEECPHNQLCCSWNNELGEHTQGTCAEVCTFSSIIDPPSPPLQSTLPPSPSPSGEVYGDPHIYFPNGGYTDFRGLNNTFFNILSDKNISVAAKTMYVSFLLPKPMKVDGSFFTEISSMFLTKNTKIYVYINTNDYCMYLKNDREKKRVCDEIKIDDVLCKIKYHTYTLENGNWKVTFERKKIYNSLTKGLNNRFDISLTCLKECSPHGLIGQSFNFEKEVFGKTDDYKNKIYLKTESQAEGAIEGSYLDYIVEDLDTHKFKYTRFNSNTVYKKINNKTAYSNELYS